MPSFWVFWSKYRIYNLKRNVQYPMLWNIGEMRQFMLYFLFGFIRAYFGTHPSLLLGVRACTCANSSISDDIVWSVRTHPPYVAEGRLVVRVHAYWANDLWALVVIAVWSDSLFREEARLNGNLNPTDLAQTRYINLSRSKSMWKTSAKLKKIQCP